MGYGTPRRGPPIVEINAAKGLVNGFVGGVYPAAFWGISSEATAEENTEGFYNAFTFIQAAGGGTLQLPPGTILVEKGDTFHATKGAVLVPSKVRLVGAGVGVTIIKLDDTTAADTPVLKLEAGATDVEIAHLTVDGNRTRAAGEGGEDEGISISPNGSTKAERIWIHHVHVKDCGQEGIDNDGCDGLWIEDALIENCWGNGIHALGAVGNDNLFITRVRVKDCAIGRYGVGDETDTISNTAAGIDSNADTLVLTDSVIEGCPRGILIERAIISATVRGNHVIDVTAHGILVQNQGTSTFAKNVVIEGNFIRTSGGSATGIWVRTGSHVTVARNIIQLAGSDDIGVLVQRLVSASATAAAVDGLDIDGNRIYISGGTNQYGIVVKPENDADGSPLASDSAWTIRNNSLEGVRWGIRLRLVSGPTGVVQGNTLHVQYQGVRLEDTLSDFSVKGNTIHCADRPIAFVLTTATNLYLMENQMTHTGANPPNPSGTNVLVRNNIVNDAFFATGVA